MTVMIIAEAGINHCGRLDYAVEIIKVAKDAGCDAVKFQAYTPAIQSAGNCEIIGLLKQCHLSQVELETLSDTCSSIGIEFMCTAFGGYWLEILLKTGIRRIKISSGKVKDRKLIEMANYSGLPIIISNGMISDREMIEIVQPEIAARTTILYCVSQYPAPDERIDLSEIKRLRDLFVGCAGVGYSCHAVGPWASIAAAYAGATIIEKHVTTSRSLPGPDQAGSLETCELAHWVKQIRSAT